MRMRLGVEGPAYFYGEDRTLTEIFNDRLNTDVPEGYHYDYISPEALMTLLSVENGRVVTPSGMSYRVLFVPPFVTRWTLPALQRLRALVNAGAAVVAPRPLGGPFMDRSGVPSAGEQETQM